MAANGMRQRRATGVRIVPDDQAGDQGAGRGTDAQHGQHAPSECMGKHADSNRPTEHIQRCRKEDTVGCNGDTGGDDVLPQGHGPAGLIDRQGDAEEREPKQQPRRDRHNDEAA